MGLDLVIDRSVRDRFRGELRAELDRTVRRMVRAASLTEGPTIDLDVSLRLVDDAAMRLLNREFRCKDKPTDVLAFAQREGRFSALAGSSLGDVVISIESAGRQARRGLGYELTHLAAHGLCHLLGYDHRDDAEEAIMNKRARALLAAARRPGRVRAA